MREILNGAMVFVLIAASLMIGTGVYGQTVSIMNGTGFLATTAGGPALLESLFTSASNTMTTFTNFLPIIAIALVGGLALAYLGSYILRGAGAGQ